MEDLTSCVNVMNELLDGTPINQVAFRLERDVKPILSARIKEHEVLFNAFLEAFMKFANNNVYFSGKENLLYQPEYDDVNKLRRLVSAFENSQSWKSLEPIALEDGVTVRIGNDSPIQDLMMCPLFRLHLKQGISLKDLFQSLGRHVCLMKELFL